MVRISRSCNELTQKISKVRQFVAWPPPLPAGAGFEIKLDDPEAELSQAVSIQTAILQTVSMALQLWKWFACQDQYEKVVDNFKLLDQSKTGHVISPLSHKLSIRCCFSHSRVPYHVRTAQSAAGLVKELACKISL